MNNVTLQLTRTGEHTLPFAVIAHVPVNGPDEPDLFLFDSIVWHNELDEPLDDEETLLLDAFLRVHEHAVGQAIRDLLP